jgi:predicted dehydrogenase/threonine dehydrogenase-like Zn-dependent dehydrogenase
MLAILADMKSGDVGTFEIPTPELRAGGVLVRTAFSAISAGTESNTIDTGKKSLIGKALARPDLVKQVVQFAKANGVRSAYQRVQSRLDAVTALGYSSAGTVLATADGVGELRPGDRVACAGAGYASHSEINFVPRNLVVKVPDQVSLEAASLTTIGAIAMQGLRQAEASFGATVAVIGAGLLGILAVQLARAAGCRVIAVDANSARAKQALEFGAHLGLTTSDPSLLQKIAEFTKYGADAAIITAGASSTGPVELAATVLRDRGRVVVVGAVPLGVSRDLMYRKELSLVLSRSYGPGRYDPSYEEAGNDYPIGYVRWTEQRNMEAFLEFVSSGAIKLDSLLRLRYRIEDGARAYSEIRASGAYTAILEYDTARLVAQTPTASASLPRASRTSLRVGCIGAGSFARGVIFPQLRAVPGVQLETVATASGASAFSAQKAFHFRQSQQSAEILASSDVDAVFVMSRHDSHADYVLSAINSQKPVFVEKPLARNSEELDSIRDAYRREQNAGRSPFVMVGFNRRFSPATEKIQKFFAGRLEPMVVHIRVNAGHLPREHWTQQKGGGGRIVGEVCHFLDFARSLVGSGIVSVHTTGMPDGSRYNQDNIAITISFADGSIGTILYLANGDRSLPKESYEIFCEGSVARLHDFQSIEFFRNGKRTQSRCNRDKGHRKEIELTVSAMRNGGPSPIAFEELFEVTKASHAVADSLNYGLPVRLQGDQEIPTRTSDSLDGLIGARKL